MTETIKNNDFIEIEYLGRTDGEVFDTNVPEELKKINPQAEAKPLVVVAGKDMLVKGFDKELEGKEIGKKYSIKIAPEEAYGNRNPKLIKLIPKRVFSEHKMNPVAGMTVSLDNQVAKIVSASGGRVLVDFNNPLSGKDLEFDFTITKKITDIKQKINTLQEFYFRQVFEYDIDEKAKKIIFKEVQLAPVLNMFKDKFKDLVGMDLEIFAKKEDKPKEAKPEDKKE